MNDFVFMVGCYFCGKVEVVNSLESSFSSSLKAIEAKGWTTSDGKFICKRCAKKHAKKENKK